MEVDKPVWTAGDEALLLDARRELEEELIAMTPEKLFVQARQPGKQGRFSGLWCAVAELETRRAASGRSEEEMGKWA